MTSERYILMCEEFGDEIDWAVMPPDFMDFPGYVHSAIRIFNALPDNYTGTMETVLYVGKDYGALSTLFELYQVADEDRLLVFDVVQFLDSRARRKAVEAVNKKSKSK
jgi:hypothetical protein